jgi:hypothetical protein
VTSEETLDCASNLPVQEKETLALPLSSSSSATKSASECGELKEKICYQPYGSSTKKVRKVISLMRQENLYYEEL